MPVLETGCVGYCQREVFVDLVTADGVRLTYCDLGPETVDEWLEDVFGEGELRNRFLLGRHDDPDDLYRGVPPVGETPFFARQTKVVLQNCGVIDPASLDAALAAGGFRAAARALGTMTPAEVCDEVIASGLRGRGGAGFPTGRKWKVAHDQPKAQKYLICNADEGDPGAFMDRAVLESDPFRVVEGMLIAAYAIGATKGYVYCRAEYPLAIERLGEAIRQCRAAGLLGLQHPRHPHRLRHHHQDGRRRVRVRRGDGDPGEHRGRARHAPSPPALPRGQRPARLPHGAQQRRDAGQRAGGDRPRRAVVQRPRVRRTRPAPRSSPSPAACRTPASSRSPSASRCARSSTTSAAALRPATTSRPCRSAARAAAASRTSTSTSPTDYGTLQELGAMMGSGGMVVMDERSCMVDVAKFFMEFIRNESCGKCTPCREGTTRMHEILNELTERPVGDDLRRLERFRGILHLEELAETVKETSLCGLGQSAANPVLSTLRFFRDEYEAHVMESTCPAGACTGLRVFDIDPELCTGCALCAKNCPSGAVIGKRKFAHSIIVDRCTGCGACADACPKQAVLAVA